MFMAFPPLKTMKEFKANVDAWIKDINSQFSHFQHIPHKINEHQDNIQYNFELIKEMQDEIDELKQEVKALTLLHIAHLKNKI